MKTNWTENNRGDFSAVKVTSGALPPTQSAVITTQRGTLSIQPSAARPRVNLPCVLLSAHDAQCNLLFESTKYRVVKQKGRQN